MPDNKVVLVILITAAVMLLVGTIILQGRALITEPSSWPRTDYDRLIAIMTFSGTVIIGIGVVLLVLLGGSAATMRTDLPEGVRRSWLISTAIILAAWLFFSFITMNTSYIGP